jgi:ATP-binding cassette subfamily B protein
MATDVSSPAFLGKNLPSGATKEQVVAGLRAQGMASSPTLVERLDIVPGQAIDFTLLGQLLLLAHRCLYVVASLLLWFQGYC